VIGKNGEMSPFQQVAEVKDAAVHGEELSVEGAVPALCRAQLLGEESQRLPGLPCLSLLQYGADMGA
jgi:hypothetical protein